MALQSTIFEIEINKLNDVPAQSMLTTTVLPTVDDGQDTDMIWTPIDDDERVHDYDTDQESPMNESVMEMTTNDSIMEMSIDESVDESPIGRGYASSDTSTRHDLTLEVAIMPRNEISRISLEEVDTSVEPVPALTSSSSDYDPNSSSSDYDPNSSGNSSSSLEAYQSVPKKETLD